MIPFLNSEQVATEFAGISEGTRAALEHHRERLIQTLRKSFVGRYLFLRRKGAARPGRKHSLHGKIIDLDGERIHVEYYTELGKHLEWFTESEAHIFVCECS